MHPVLHIVTDDADGILLILLEQWSLIIMPSVPVFVGAVHQDAETETQDVRQRRGRRESKLSGEDKGGGG